MEKQDEINIWDLLIILARKKALIILVTLAFAVAGLLIALFTPSTYTVQAVIGPTEESKSPTSLGSLSGLASIFGANLSFLTGGDTLQTIKQTLHSSDFLLYANEENNFTDLLDKEYGTIEEQLSFLRRLVNVREDSVNATISITIESMAPDLSFLILNKLMSSLNEYVIKKQTEQSSHFVTKLREEIRKTSDPVLKAELSAMWASESKKLILAEINQNNLYQIHEKPFIPDQRSRPKRKLILMVSIFLGFFTGVILALGHEYFKRMKDDPETSAYIRELQRNLSFKKKEGR